MKRTLNRIRTLLVTGCFLAVAARGAAAAAESATPAPGKSREAAAKFPEEVVTPQMTETEKAAYEKNLTEAAATYREILKYAPEGRRETLKANLEFIRERIASALQEQTEAAKQLAELKADTARKGRSIVRSGRTKSAKIKALLNLKAAYQGQADYLQYRLDILPKQVAKLRQREAELEAAITDVGAPLKEEVKDPLKQFEEWAKKIEHEEDKRRGGAVPSPPVVK